MSLSVDCEIFLLAWLVSVDIRILDRKKERVKHCALSHTEVVGEAISDVRPG